MACFACARDGRILRRGTRWGTDMRKLAAVLFGVAAWLVTGGSAWAAIEVEVVEAWPAGDAVTIGTNQNYYLRIAYRTDETAHIWARPWVQGREVGTGSHTSPESEEGSGAALRSEERRVGKASGRMGSYR